MLEIDIRPWNTVEIDEIASVIHATQGTANGASSEALSRQLAKELNGSDCSLVLAWEDTRLAGLFGLAPATPSTLIMNPDQILGRYSQALPDHMSGRISTPLIKKAVEWASQKGYRQIELMLPLIPDGQINHALGSWYESLDFVIKLSYVEMICYLAQQTLPALSVPAGLELVPLREANRDELYHCYEAAFRAGDAQFFHQQTTQEQRAYFDTLGLEEAREEPASLVIRQDGRLLGFALVLPYGRLNRHISCMCVHPERQRTGLGKLMLSTIMQQVTQQNFQTITLGTETGMRAFDLYRQFNFEIVEGSAIYQLSV